MDYDDDGIEDFISGSYDPGGIYLFRGLGGGEFAAGEGLVDENNIPLVHHPSELTADPESTKSFGSWGATVDWDNDGDLDMLIGTLRGELILRINSGTRSTPVYSTKALPVNSAGAPLKEHSHANPVVADWDGDGLWDIVVGSGNGSVAWYRNTGRAGEPNLGPRRELIGAASKSDSVVQYLSEGQTPLPGVRAQICVSDYNSDGLLDLIVGDYSYVFPKANLNTQQNHRLNQLIARQQLLMDATAETLEKYRQLHKSNPGSVDGSRVYEELGEYNGKLGLIETAIVALLNKEPRNASFIWLYTRKPGPEA